MLSRFICGQFPEMGSSQRRCFSRGGSAYAQGVFDTFTVNCRPLAVQRRDPIVSPSADLLDHVHPVIGGANFFAGTPPANAQTSAATTCDKELDHSIYWVPQLYHITAVYYQNWACDYDPGLTSCPSYKTKFARPFPERLQMVAGDPTKRTFDPSAIEQRSVNHLCFLGGGGSVQTKSLALAGHLPVLFYPDPRYGDYNGGMCLESHPIAVITIFYEFFFNTSKYNDRNFHFAQGDKTGNGFRG
ncbi:hypothetical protein DL766_008592 [Monosporascus sp. MC13-8B]|uniref:DUF1996 domain-containing protein n=1 Tax=Monosporascus cannonballus TaxID=155416 RepID=A0ABY0H7X8_9PEZI|nr:hypothetical protein DL763_007276 [Monosporascus cannonballus]RYO87159.1 hypothetical protein DL762_004363 [Monosporascus cannonballus]RYP18770.1 hypothetical protein DL766_008592 [Monosporascus sp. MC13-8B]